MYLAYLMEFINITKMLTKKSMAVGGWCGQPGPHPGSHQDLSSPRTSSDPFVNTLRPRQNHRRFADDTFKRIFSDESVRISIKISLKIVPKGPINNNPALVHIMAWRRSGD